MIQNNIPFASYEPWLKGWAYGWLCAVLEVPPGSRVLDVGCGSSPYFARYFVKNGCEAHGMDAKYEPSSIKTGWGIPPETITNNPDITFHLGLAGQEIGPANYFDLITCVSTMEHIYDSTNVIDAEHVMPHIDALYDMARMLKPGGVLALTYDFFLGDMPHWRGWDFLTDIRILELAGLSLLSNERARSRTYIFNCEDTLFMAPEGILSFADVYMRSTSIGLIFRKKGPANSVRLSRRAELEKVLFPAYESTPQPVVNPASDTRTESPMRGQLLNETRTADLFKVALSRVRQRIFQEIIHKS